MLKNLLQLTLLSVLLKHYRTVIISTLLLFLGFWLLGQLHDDYIRYSELNDDKRFLALSFFIKWSLYILAVIAYLFYNARFSLRVGSGKDLAAGGSSDAESGHKAEAEDPFAEIRQRDKLRSRADFVIEKTRPHD